MSTTPGSPTEQDEPVGHVLARLRRARRLTGAELAYQVGMSQPKISRIERGVHSPAPKDIAAIAKALGVDEGTTRRLTQRAEWSQNRLTDWRPTATSPPEREKAVALLEAAADAVRDFQPAILTGLLQTSGYARAVLLAFQRSLQPDAEGLSEEEAASRDLREQTVVLPAIAARVARQQVLADPTKAFSFVLTEATLASRLCPPAEMLAQISHLRDLAAQPNIGIRVITSDTRLALPPIHGFTLFDDTALVIDTYNTDLIGRGRQDVAIYGQFFDVFQQQSEDIAPLLDKYLEIHLRRLTRS